MIGDQEKLTSSTNLRDALGNLPLASRLLDNILMKLTGHSVFTVRDALVIHTLNPCFLGELLYPTVSIDELESILMYLCALEIPLKSDWAQSAGTLSTNLPSIDNLLSKGFLRGATYEICGEAGSGKSTIAMHTCLQAVASGLSALYFTVEQFSHTRLKQLIEGHVHQFKENSSVVPDFLERFILCRIPDWRTLLMRLEILETFIKTVESRQRSIGIIVVDSMAALQSCEFDSYSNESRCLKNIEVQRYVQKFALTINQLCAKYSIVALLINQVREAKGFILPALGYHWSKGITTRILIQKKQGRKREMKIAYSTYLMPKAACFELGNFGLVNYDDRK